MTSLMDIAFVLLLIFMITAPMLQGGVDVELPKAVAKPLTTKEGLIISVDRTGRVFVDMDGIASRNSRRASRASSPGANPTGSTCGATDEPPMDRWSESWR